MQTIDLIHSLPKAELHLHFEGALAWDMVQSHVSEPLPDSPHWWANDFQFEKFEDFLKPFYLCLNILTSIDKYNLAAQGIFKRLFAQNVRYVEISFSMKHAVSQGLPLTEVIAAIKEAAPAGLTVSVFCGFNRGTPHIFTDDVIKNIFDTPNLDGLDLHGDENAFGPAPFADIFLQARERGLHTKAHAGEYGGPQSIKDTLDLLKVTRIEHGVTAIQDESLLSRLAAENITLDMCPISNFRLKIVDDITAHPIHRFHQRGINVTVSTDDPTIFGNSLTDELYTLATKLHFSMSELAELQVNAFQVAKLPATIKEELLAEIDDWLAHIESSDDVAG